MSSRPSAVRGQSRTAITQQSNASAGVANKNTRGAGVFGLESQTHPLKQDWTFYYVHRPPTAKFIEYEKEIRKVASFGSIESFWSIYAHLLSPSVLPPVTDLLLFASSIRRPVWEELPNGGKWVLRLRKGVADRLWEDSILSLIGDQFDEEEGIVGMVLSVRGQEDILSVWSDREREGGTGSELVDTVRDKLITLLGLPPTTVCDYKSNRSQLETAAQKSAALAAAHSNASTPTTTPGVADVGMNGFFSAGVSRRGLGGERDRENHKPSTHRDEVEQQQENIQEKVEKQADESKATETDIDRTAKGSATAVIDGRAKEAPTP
ncbi:hypothetical protein NliqN6_6759 [Naganishia liquefaciens]|uniref:Uncharacterized protein n=1 Tax=Naganishia liquefaciens TaxID=104408 RepID=A0A8H3YJN7_9TREE|nr:hypothetical protein NliqN6_6759 [Naganishia liquefaciens]